LKPKCIFEMGSNLFLKKALPEPDFKYRSNSAAFFLLPKTANYINFTGNLLFV